MTSQIHYEADLDTKLEYIYFLKPNRLIGTMRASPNSHTLMLSLESLCLAGYKPTQSLNVLRDHWQS